MFILTSIQRKRLLPHTGETWQTFHHVEKTTPFPIRFRLYASQHTFFFVPAPECYTLAPTEPTLRWGTTKTADNETIRVLFTVDRSQPIGRNLTLHPAYRTILSKLFDRDDKNIYFKRSNPNEEHPYSRYYVFHSLNPVPANPEHFLITVVHTTIAAVRIESAHRNIPLYRIFMRANKKYDWQTLPGQTEVSVLCPDIPNRIHEAILKTFVHPPEIYHDTYSSSSNNGEWPIQNSSPSAPELGHGSYQW